MIKRFTAYNGHLQDFNLSLLEDKLKQANQVAQVSSELLTKIIQEAALTLYEEMPEADLDKALTLSVAQNIKLDPAYDKLAAGLLLNTIYREAVGFLPHQAEFAAAYGQAWQRGLRLGIEKKWLSPNLEKFSWGDLATVLDPQRDTLFTYAGLATLARRYLLRDDKQNLIETPQFFWMRVAMGLSWNETELEKWASQFYDRMSQLYYVAGGSTNVNAGALNPRLSNCFLMQMEDSVDHIGKTVSDVLKLSKATGGIGLAVTKLRASGSPIATNNTFSSGPIPFLHIIDSAIRAISRAGKKMGALCFYMENWHYDFQEYVDLKQNAGDDYRRTRTANISAYLSDEFMKRVKTDDYWYLFDPKETPDLIDLYGEAFSKRYQEYCEMAEAGKLRVFKKMKATDQFRQIIVSLQASAHPWITFKDAINVRALNNNTGTIYGSNLCTEITLPTNKDNIAVCNLTSINLVRHLKNVDYHVAGIKPGADKAAIDWDALALSTRLAVRQLDNLVDINQPPATEAINFDSNNRAVGLGVMGLADMFEHFNLPYDSTEAYQLVDEIMEFISYHAISASTELAKERGSYNNFSGSLWSQGYVPIDTISVLAKERDSLKQDTSTRLDWDALRQKVKLGMRNSTLLAIAPTANIGLVAGTSTGIDPRFAQIFSRNTLGGKHLELNVNLVEKLKELNLWERAKDDILSSYGDISQLDYIPEELKKVYKDSFSVDPQAFVEVASRAQKWVDQAISRNIYLATREIEEVMAVYLAAWEKGLKTTYYLHMKPRHNAEQSTVAVNKSAKMGRVGFGAAKAFGAVKIVSAVSDFESTVCPTDPQERAQCDSCQ